MHRRASREVAIVLLIFLGALIRTEAAEPIEPTNTSETVAQLPEAVEERLPTVGRAACKAFTDSLEILERSEISADGVPARGQFRKTTPEGMPKALSALLTQRRREFRELYEATRSARGPARDSDQALGTLSEEAQRFMEKNFRVAEGRALTPLMAFMTKPTGETEWCLFYILIADANALRGKSPAFTAEVVGGDRLFVMILGRSIDRARLGTAVAIGWGPYDLSLVCGPVSARNLPPVRKRRGRFYRARAARPRPAFPTRSPELTWQAEGDRR